MKMIPMRVQKNSGMALSRRLDLGLIVPSEEMKVGLSLIILLDLVGEIFFGGDSPRLGLSL